MKVSCRITNSFYSFLTQKNFDTSYFYELSSLEMHFISDPSVWAEAETVENFIKKVSEEYGPHFVDEELIEAVGHSAVRLKAWGELDHVLKLGQFFNIYQQTKNILRWFISPCSLESFQHTKNIVSFKCGLSSQKYPYLAAYLRSALEALPMYQSEEMTHVQWEGRRVQIQYTPYGQMSFFGETEKDPSHSLRKLKQSLFYLEKECLRQKNILEEQGKKIKQLESCRLKKEKLARFCSLAEDVLNKLKESSLENPLVKNKISDLSHYVSQIKGHL